MTSIVSIRRAFLEDVETLVDLRLALERESDHLTQNAMPSHKPKRRGVPDTAASDMRLF